MAITEKGITALKCVFKFCPNEKFSAKELSEKAEMKIAPATLTALANNGYLEKFAGTPATYKAIYTEEDIKDVISPENKATNQNLQKAKKAKNDEFYTIYEDIEKEVFKYRKQLKDKVIYLPCDDPLEKNSEFWNYFVNNFDAFGLKKVIATHYDENGGAYKIWIEQDINGDGFVDDKDVLQEDLVGNGDFRSPECTDILNECDIVITNPPFSMFREFITWIMKANKKFLIIGNMNAVTYKEIFPLIKNNKIWTGYSFNKTFEFIMSDDYELKGKGYIDKNGKKHGFVPAICWFTNLKTVKMEEELILTKEYNPIDYPKYDNYDAIEVNKVVNIPKDYYGIMGVPITFLDKYCPEQFEIVGHEHDLNGDGGDGIAHGQFEVNGKGVYKRILIRKKADA